MVFETIIDYLTSKDLDVLVPLTVLVILLIVPWGVTVWQNVFSVIFLLKGCTLLLFPEKVADFVIKNKSDAVHLQEIRCIGIILISEAVVHLLLRKSSDPTVKTSLLWSRTVFVSLATMLVYLTTWTAADSKKNNLNIDMMKIGLPATGLVVCGFLYYSLTQSDWGGYAEPVTQRRNVHIRIDFIIYFFHGILSFVFPRIACQFQTTLTELDTAHGYLARLMAVGFLSAAVLSGRCVNFLREEDKKSVLLSHALENTFFLLTAAFCQIFTKVFSEWHLYYGMGFIALTAINCLMGCDVPHMVKSAKIQLRKLTTTHED